MVVARDGLTLGELPAGSRVGTGSPRAGRRSSHALGLGVEVRRRTRQRGHPDRQGRLGGVRRGRARPGRTGPDRSARRGDRGARPAPDAARPGQGALAVECRADDDLVAELAALDDPHTRAAVEAERAVLATLEAGCSAPIGALAEVAEGDDGDELWVRAVALSPDGGALGADVRHRDPDRRRGLGTRLASEMLADGAAESVQRKNQPQTRCRTHDPSADHHRHDARERSSARSAIWD